ncbi:MAG: molybdopterin-guanine dinucleotide biosynthesis protein B [Pseudomonadota bacterium]
MKIICIAGPSGSGKTLLIEQIIPELTNRGLRVATAKHTCHEGVSLDTKGKDTYRHRKAGAETVFLISPDSYYVLAERKGRFSLSDVLALHDPGTDILIAEGFKHENFPKVELVPEGSDSLFLNDKSLLAIVSESPIAGSPVPYFRPSEISRLVDFIISLVNEKAPQALSPTDS